MTDITEIATPGDFAGTKEHVQRVVRSVRGKGRRPVVAAGPGTASAVSATSTCGGKEDTVVVGASNESSFHSVPGCPGPGTICFKFSPISIGWHPPVIPPVNTCGIVFLFIVLSSITSTERGEIPLTLLLIMAIYLGGEVYDMIYTTDNISHLAHIIGGCFGAYFGFRFLKENPDPRTY